MCSCIERSLIILSSGRKSTIVLAEITRRPNTILKTKF